MASIMYDNPIFVNNKLSETRILFLGRNETTKKVDLYAVGLVECSDLSGITRRYLNITSESNYISSNSGAIVADMISAQSNPEGTFDLECSIDYNMQNTKAKAGVTTNLLESIIRAQGFYFGADFIRIIGTNGTLKTGGLKATKCDLNHTPAISFFYKEINNLDTGSMDGDKPVFTSNNFQKSKLEVASFALETYELLSSGNSSSTLIPYCYTANTSFTTADDTTKMSASLMRPCDAWDATESLLTGQREYNVITDLEKSYFEVDYIVQNAGGTAPLDFAKNGDTACVIDSADGSFAIYTSNGTAKWTANAVGGFTPYAKISANKFATGTSVATPTVQRAFAVVNSTGAVNNAGTMVNTYDEGVTLDFVYKTFTPNRLTQQWEAYAVASEC